MRHTPSAATRPPGVSECDELDKSLNRLQDLAVILVKGVGAHRILQPFPQMLDQVKLRRVGREIQEMKTLSFFLQKLLHHSSMVQDERHHLGWDTAL